MWMLVIAYDLPQTLWKRTKILEEPDRAIEAFLGALWKQGIYTDVIPILKTPEEAEKMIPFYLDMVEDAVIFLIGRIFYSNPFGTGNLKPDYSSREIFQI